MLYLPCRSPLLCCLGLMVMWSAGQSQQAIVWQNGQWHNSNWQLNGNLTEQVAALLSTSQRPDRATPLLAEQQVTQARQIDQALIISLDLSKRFIHDERFRKVCCFAIS